MGEDVEKDPEAVVFYLYKNVEEMKKNMGKIESSLNKIHVDLALLQEGYSKPSRAKIGATGGGAGAVLGALVIAVWEYFKRS